MPDVWFVYENFYDNPYDYLNDYHDYHKDYHDYYDISCSVSIDFDILNILHIYLSITSCIIII